MTIISIDAGGTNIKIGLVKDGKIIARGCLPAISEKGLKPRLELIELEVNKLLEEKNINKEAIDGIGLSIPGIIDVHSMKVLDINDKYNDMIDLDLQSWANNAWGAPFILESDARSGLVGSWQYGSGKGVNDLALVTLGTGIGTAVIIDGQILYGKHYQAGILGGHFIIDHKGRKCNCGNIGCAEANASSWQLPTLIKEHPGFQSSQLSSESCLDFESLFTIASHNDSCALYIRDYCIDVWAATIINIIHAYDPELVLLAGGVMKSAEIILPAIQKTVDSHAWTPWGKVKVGKEENMDDAALLGLEYLLKKRYKL